MDGSNDPIRRSERVALVSPCESPVDEVFSGRKYSIGDRFYISPETSALMTTEDEVRATLPQGTSVILRAIPCSRAEDEEILVTFIFPDGRIFRGTISYVFLASLPPERRYGSPLGIVGLERPQALSEADFHETVLRKTDDPNIISALRSAAQRVLSQ